MRCLSLGLSLLLYATTHAMATAPIERAEPYMLLAQSDIGSEVEGELDSDEGAEDAAFPDNFVFPRIPLTFPANAEAPGLTEFLASLKAIAEKRDDAALVATVAPKIFWDRDFGGGFDEAASGVENFRQALQIGIPDMLPEYADEGWKRLISLLISGRLSTEADHPGAYCTPVAPTLTDAAAAEKTFKDINMAEDQWQLYWGYVDAATPVRKTSGPDGEVIATVQSEALPVHDWGIVENVGWAEIGLPDGRHGFIDASIAYSWTNERICFGQTDGKWSVVGYYGGGD